MYVIAPNSQGREHSRYIFQCITLDSWVLGYVFLADKASTILKKSIEILNNITDWVILPLESTFGTYPFIKLLETVYSNETIPNPKPSYFTTPAIPFHQKLQIACRNSH